MKVLNLLTQAWATSVWVETRSMYCDTVASSQVLGASSQVTVDCFKKLSGKDWSWSQRVGDFYVGWLLRTQNSSQENCSSVVTVDLFLQKQEQVTLYLGDNGFSPTPASPKASHRKMQSRCTSGPYSCEPQGGVCFHSGVSCLCHRVLSAGGMIPVRARIVTEP